MTTYFVDAPPNTPALSTGVHGVERRSMLKAALGGVAFAALACIPGTAHASLQEGWRWCRKCHGMFFAFDRQRGFGRCPAGGSHDPSTSDHYYLRIEPEIPGVQQGGWSRCLKCTGLYAAVGSNMGVCPVGGVHDNFSDGYASDGYAVVLGEEGTGQQGGWRWCAKCMGMFYARSGGGRCPVDGAPHDGARSLHYAQLT